jgi:hypothetical protein
MRRLRSAIRSRVTLPRLALAAVLVAAVVAASALLDGKERGAPADHAVRLVPASAVLYVHGNVDTSSTQWKRGSALLRRFPPLIRLRNQLLRGLTARGAALDLEREVGPWLGDEAALALIPDQRGNARSLILLEVSDRELARSFLARAVGRERVSSYRGRRLRSYGGLATTFLGGFLAIGQAQNVREAIDVLDRRSPSLASDAIFRRTRAAIPDRDRLLYAFAPRLGVRRVLEPRTDLAGRLGRLVDEPDLEGVALVLRVEKSGARILSATARRGSAAAIDRPFAPDLVDVVSEDAIAFADMHGADRIFSAITAFAGGSSLPLPPALRELRSYFGGRGGRSFVRRLGPVLEKEAALFVSRSAAVPVVTLVVDGIGESEADQLLARLQPALTSLLSRPSAAGQVPTFQPQRVGGVNAATLRISPALELTYAIFGGRAVVATSPGGILRVKTAHSHVRDNPLFAPGMRDDLDRVTSVLFFDLEQLLALGQQAGLGASPGFESLQSELAPVKAVSAITRLEGDTKTAETFIEVK